MRTFKSKIPGLAIRYAVRGTARVDLHGRPVGRITRSDPANRNSDWGAYVGRSGELELVGTAPTMVTAAELVVRVYCVRQEATRHVTTRSK